MVTFNVNEGNLICRFSTKLDNLACMELEQHLYEKIKDIQNKIYFDLDKVECISSMFTRICFKIFKMVGKDRFEIVNASQDVMKVFKVAKFESLININPVHSTQKTIPTPPGL